MSPAASRHERVTLRHGALLYRGDDEYLSGVGSFVRSALDADQPTLIAVPASKVALLRGAMNGLAGRVQLVDMGDFGRNPGRIIPAVRRFIDEHPRQPVSFVGEPIWPQRSAQEYAACVQHEALINLAYDGCDASILCPYDAAALTPQVLADAERTHPVVIEGAGRSRPSRLYGSPQQVAADAVSALPDPPASAQTLIFTRAAAVRVMVTSFARQVGLAVARLSDLVLAVDEVATNSLRHANGVGVLRIWVTDHAVVCEVRDAGHISDPMAGRVEPSPDAEAGRGLLLVNHLCDLVHIQSTASGTVVRITIDR